MLKSLIQKISELLRSGTSPINSIPANSPQENVSASTPPNRAKSTHTRTSAVDDKPWEKRQAYYDAGQVVIVWHLSFVRKMQNAVIIANQSYSTLYALDEYCTEEQIWGRLLLHTSGIASQTRFQKKFSSSQCRTDLASARALARDLATIHLYNTRPWGQIARHGVDLGNLFRPPLSQEERHILNYSYDKACSFIDKRRDTVEQIADILYENGALSSGRIDEILGNRSSVHLVGATGKTFVEFY